MTVIRERVKNPTLIPPHLQSSHEFMSADGVGCGTGSDGCWHHELSYASLESTDSGYTQQPWLPDELVTKCMLCQQPFGMWRWSHHCRDCGGCFCRECTRHRVDSLSKDGPATLRLCDRCAFSSAHPEHLGCECAPTTTLRTMPTPRITWSSHTLPNAHRRPLQCSRCSFPRSERQLCVYVLLVVRVAACGFCAPCATSIASCLGTPAATPQAPPPPPVSTAPSVLQALYASTPTSVNYVPPTQWSGTVIKGSMPGAAGHGAGPGARACVATS